MQKQTRDRNREGAKKLWQSFTLSLSIVRRLWSVISGKPTHCVIPSKRHQTVGKEKEKKQKKPIISRDLTVHYAP